jgi:hypothetical protein
LGLAAKIFAAAVIFHSLLSLIAFGGYFLFGSVILCETECSLGQKWLAAGLAFSPVMLLLSVLAGSVALFGRASKIMLVLTFAPAAAVETIRIIDRLSMG